MNTLILTFVDNENNSTTFEFNYADPNVSVSDVNSLVNAMIQNGSIFEIVPTRCTSALIQLSSGDTRTLITEEE